jgi:SSS family solute:Na+ symporter
MIGALSNVFFYSADKGFTNGESLLAIEAAKGNPDLIIPIFIREALPPVVLYIFALTMLSAAMSTLSSLFHVSGSSIGHDICGKFNRNGDKPLITRLGVCFGILISLFFAFILPEGVVARGTAIFFGVCAAAFLPAYTAALYWKRATRAGVWAAIAVGAGVSAFGLLFLHRKESAMLGICETLFGKTELISIHPWPYVDPFVYALPLSIITLIIISLCTAPPDKEHLEKCFDLR